MKMTDDKNISNISDDSGKGISVISKKGEMLLRKYILKGKTIGISISESDNLSELGYGVPHLKDAVIEIARYILASGGKLAYGGDMRQGGFTELIFELLAYYKADKTLQPHERFYSYLAYPLSTTLSIEKEAELRQNVSFIKVVPPSDLQIATTNEFLKPDTPDNLYVWTRCLTKMREEMESECNARIFIGGRTKGFKGKCAGILEEFLIALEYNHPIYLVGAFGGITKDIIEALRGRQPDSFSNEYYFDNDDYKKMFLHFNGRHPDNKIDYLKYLTTLQQTGLNKIATNNGLSKEDNLRLTTTPHISEVVYLILKGLTKRFKK
jgi:SLOG cluster2